jgi:hypothetical protein
MMPVELFSKQIAFDQGPSREQKIQAAPAVPDGIADETVARRVADRDVAHLGDVVALDAVVHAVPEAHAVAAIGRINAARTNAVVAHDAVIRSVQRNAEQHVFNDIILDQQIVALGHQAAVDGLSCESPLPRRVRPRSVTLSALMVSTVP